MAAPSKQIVQNLDVSINLMRKVSEWMSEHGKVVSQWWDLKNLNREFLLQHAEEEEFYVLQNQGTPAASFVIQKNDPSWKKIDGEKEIKSLYLHWICVSPSFMGEGLLQNIVDYAKILAKQKGISLLRCDTNAHEPKLRRSYEKLGFKLVKEIDEDYRRTAFYQMEVSQ